MKSYIYLGLIATSAAATSCGSTCGDMASHPNVLLILTDDQGWGDFGFNGNEVINTPVLDSLSRRAAHLTNFHVSPLSASTRAGILTGRDHLRTGAMSVTRASENMDEREQTIAEVLRDNNYATGCFGKWHNGAHYPQDPNGQGFDEFRGFCAGHLTNYFDSRLQHNQRFFNAEGYITDVLTDYAIEFIDSSIENQRPFFCYVPYNAPHAPYQVPDEYYNKYASIATSETDMTPAVYAMCENIDHNVGRLLQHLNQRGLDESTIVVFMSDNGPNNERYNGVLRGRKGMSYEGGFKVPCLIYWKGRVESIKLPQTASYVDIMPTILDLCDIESTPAEGRNISGVSLKPLLTGAKEELAERYLFTHRSYTHLDLNPYEGVIYNDTYKLITFPKGRRELYNKKTDPSERDNIADSEPQITQELATQYDAWFDEVNSEYQRSISRTAYIGLLDEAIELPSHEALMSGRTRYYTNENGWAGDWLVDMASDDTIHWDVVVAEDADYQITLQYSSTGERPHKVALTDQSAVTLTPYAAERLPSPDRSPRVEAYEQIWGSQDIGTIHLAKGANKIELHFDANSEIELGTLEIKGIVVERI